MLTHHDPLSLHVYTDHGRFYKVSGRHYPGVGTILSATDSFKQQEFWQQWRAVPSNAAHSEQAKERGKLFHSMVEQYFKVALAEDLGLEVKGVNSRLSSLTEVSAVPKDVAIAQPFWQSIQCVLPRITTPLLIESAVWHTVGHYAGTVDMVCSFDGVPCILDWKTASRPKKPEWMERYPFQLTAYCGAINRMYGTRIKYGVIVVALPKREAQIFKFDLQEYWECWLKRLVSYWEQQNTPLAEQALGMIHSTYVLCV